VPELVLELLNVWAIVAPLLLLPPVMPADCVTVHAKVVPVTLDVRAMLVAPPLQIVWLAGVAVTDGVGLTVITTFVPVPGQLLAVGIT
jgi:hypothetical protein